MRVASIISLFACLLTPLAVMAGANSILTNEEAAAEVNIVVEKIVRHHPNAFHITPKEEFYSEVDRLLAREGSVSVEQQYFDLARLSSLVFDTHTQFHVQEETPAFKSTFPLRFKIFKDGLYIIGGDQFYRDAIGKKIVSISGHDPSRVIDTLSRYSAADNWPRRRVYAESYLYWPETYDVFDLKTSEGEVELLLEDAQGNRSKQVLSHTWEKGPADFSWDSLNPFLPAEFQSIHDVMGTKVPLYLENVDNNYWFRFLDDGKKYLYVQMNQQFKKDEEDGELPIEFHLQWSRALWDSEAEVLIIDLRNNPGGTINWGNPFSGILSDMYFEHPTLRGIALLFGTDTVSAGTVIAAQMEEGVKPIMIGEPSGSSPNMYLNAEKIVLPYSLLRFEVSTEVFTVTAKSDTRAYIAPDVPMAMPFEDYVNGRDPLIEFAKTINKDLRKEKYNEFYDEPWNRPSQSMATWSQQTANR